MTSHNATPNANTTVLSVDRQQQLDLFDALPQAWRRLVDSLPVPQDLREVEAVRRRFGEEKGLQLIIEVYREQYPGWKEEESKQ